MNGNGGFLAKAPSRKGRKELPRTATATTVSRKDAKRAKNCNDNCADFLTASAG
jgi:hypothetical protein